MLNFITESVLGLKQAKRHNTFCHSSSGGSSSGGLSSGGLSSGGLSSKLPCALPVDLSRQHWETILSSPHDYLVTLKADGSRCFLVCFESSLYLVTRRCNVRVLSQFPPRYEGPTVLRSGEESVTDLSSVNEPEPRTKLKRKISHPDNFIIDGELLLLDGTEVFMAFDCITDGLDSRLHRDNGLTRVRLVNDSFDTRLAALQSLAAVAFPLVLQHTGLRCFVKPVSALDHLVQLVQTPWFVAIPSPLSNEKITGLAQDAADSVHPLTGEAQPEAPNALISDYTRHVVCPADGVIIIHRRKAYRASANLYKWKSIYTADLAFQIADLATLLTMEEKDVSVRCAYLSGKDHLSLCFREVVTLETAVCEEIVRFFESTEPCPDICILECAGSLPRLPTSSSEKSKRIQWQGIKTRPDKNQPNHQKVVDDLMGCIRDNLSLCHLEVSLLKALREKAFLSKPATAVRLLTKKTTTDL